MHRTPTRQLAGYVETSDLRDIPAHVRDRAKQVIFDELASATFGRRSPAGAMAARYACAMRGHADATIFGTMQRASAPYAALANGTAGHGEEVDGAHVVGGHPGASIVHAAAAIAERQRSCGADMLQAVIIGYDIGVRIVRACGGKFVVRDDHHLNSDLFYAVGAAAAAGRILGQNAERLVHTMALSTFQTNGLYAMYSEKRHISKSFCNGQYAFAGVSAALMSAAGLEGNEDIIGAEHGLLATWGAEEGREIVTARLGTDHDILGANFKFLNAGYPIHTAVEAAMTLVREHAIALADIETVTVGMPSRAMRVVDNRHMHMICVQDMVSASLVSGGLQISDLPFPAMLSRAEFADIRPRIVVVVDPQIEAENPDGRGARVTIARRRGEAVSLRIDHPRGHSLRGGASWEDLSAKWSGALPDCDIAAAIAAAQQLDAIDDVCELTSHFRGVRS